MLEIFVDEIEKGEILEKGKKEGLLENEREQILRSSG